MVKKMHTLLVDLFDNRKSVMAERLRVSGPKASKIVMGVQKLTVESIGVLLTEYHVDPYWLFSEDDDSPIRFSKREEIDKPGLEKKYTESLEKINMLMEEQIIYLKEKSLAKKNHTDVSG